MKNCNSPENQTTRCILPITCTTALAVAFTVLMPLSAHADCVIPPPVPYPPTFRCRRGTRFSSWVTVSAPRTTSACPQALLASSLPSSRRRPPCSMTTISKLRPTSSAPTQMRTARFAQRGSTRETRAPSGPRWPPMEPQSTPPSSHRMRFPGSYLRWLGTRRDPLVATS